VWNPAANRAGARRRGRRVIIAAVVSCAVIVAAASAAVGGLRLDPFGTLEVGSSVNGAVLLPTNQWISPLGNRILDNKARLVSSSISPNGEYLAALAWNDFSGYLTIIDLQSGQIVQSTSLETSVDGSGTDYSVGPDGPLWSPDGSTLWVPQSTFLLKFSFDSTTGDATQEAAVPLCGSALTSTACNANDGPSNASGSDLPAGMALSPDGSTLYVALNGANELGEINTATDTLTSEIPVGNAPRQVVLADGGTVAYVSNEGGRPATPGEYTNLSDGTPIVSNDVTGAASTGTVSVVNLTTGKEEEEIPVGLQPTALYQDPGTSALFVANSNDDSMSVIDEATNTVTQTVDTNPVPGAKVGSYANAISMMGDDVLVSIGRDNAIAVYKYDGLTMQMQYLGLIPTDWYPVQVQPDPALGPNEIVVTNDRGIGDRGPQTTINKGPYTNTAMGYNTYDDTGSVTTFAMPSQSALPSLTHRVFADNAWTQINPINSGDDDTVPSVIPAHLGGSSPIKHIIVIVKENRTYDQVLGDLTNAQGQPEGNGDPMDAQFGEQVTPNQHALAQRFGDFDNFYDEGTLSADGHNWIVQAEANDYVEKEFGAFYRSYPSQGGDALAYQRDGFLWNAAEKAGLSVQDFGEYAYDPYNLPSTTSNGTPASWDNFYDDSQILEGKASGPLPIPINAFPTSSDIPSLEKIIDPDFPNFQLNIPDQYRVDMWLPVFKHDEATGRMPNLSFMWLMTDHTAGAGSGDPDPVAEAADNDLAVGRVVDAVSHSKFWKSTAIFILEDDPQNGVDHVDGHRSVLWTVSPYSKGGVVPQYYSQINVVKTIEQVLGIKPMNQEDLAAEPMYSAFTEHPNFAPYDVLPNQIPLTLGAPGYPSTLAASTSDARTATEAKDAAEGAAEPGTAQGYIPADMRRIYRQWVAWSGKQLFNGTMARADRAKPALLNRLDWYSAHDWKVAYPGDPKIYPPDEVPGRNLPAAYIGDG
jgi:YVTN family beta-propeller protein